MQRTRKERTTLHVSATTRREPMNEVATRRPAMSCSLATQIPARKAAATSGDTPVENSMLCEITSPSLLGNAQRRMRASNRCVMALVVAFACVGSAEVVGAGLQAAFSEALPLTGPPSARTTNLNKMNLKPSASFPAPLEAGKRDSGVGNLLQKMQQIAPLLRGNRQRQRIAEQQSARASSSVDMEVVTEKQLAREEVASWDDLLELTDPSKPKPTSSSPTTTSPSAPSSSRQNTKIGLDCGWSCIPHPSKVHRGGEDVHIVSRAGGCTLTGVMDGVGGWADLGVDPAEYPRKLAGLIVEYFTDNASVLPETERPLLDMLHSAFLHLNQTGQAGSCTVCLSLLLPSGKLHVLNIGDSGLSVVRDGQSIFKTQEQQHYFNCPFQLGMGSDDLPEDADYFIIEELAQDDAIVIATDGVWDNLYTDAMVAMVDDPLASPEALARRVSEKSHVLGRDTAYVSPFAANARRHKLRFMGGKLDDVTVVVSRVCHVRPRDASATKSRDAAGSPVSSCDESEEHAVV